MNNNPFHYLSYKLICFLNYFNEPEYSYLGSVVRIRIRIQIWIHRIHVFLGLLDLDPDPLIRGMDPEPDPAPDSDPSIIKQKW